jgi:hypothetical protein
MASFNPWLSMVEEANMGTLTPAGFAPNPTPKGNQPQVVPPPAPKRPPFDPFSGMENPNAFVDEVPAVMDELDAMPDLDMQMPENMSDEMYYAQPQEELPSDYVPQPQVPPQPAVTAQPTTTPIGTLPSEIAPKQPSLMQTEKPYRQRLLEELDTAMGNYSELQGISQEEIDAMKMQLGDYQNMDQGVDFTPLAALSDAWFGGNLTAAAKQIAPQSPAERQQTIMALQDKIANAQRDIPKAELDAMKLRLEQLSYMDQRDNALEIAKINAEARKAAGGLSGVRAGIAQDRLASAAADVIDKDPLVKKYYDLSEQADRDVALLDTPLLTFQNLNEVQIGLARVISGGGQSAVSREEKTEFKTLGLELANLKQKLTGKPQDVASPEIVAQLKHIGERLKMGLQNNAYNRASKLAQGRGKVYKNNPVAAEVLKDKVESYKPIEMPPEGAVGGLTPEKKARMEELRKKLGK